jgi:L-gulonolactone oxidase
MPVDLPPSPSLSHHSIADLHAILAPIASTSGRRSIFTNWASTYSSQTAATFRPRNVDEVRMVVELARREGKELRASGSGHSPSDLVCTEGYIINIDEIKEVLEVSLRFFILLKSPRSASRLA